MIIASRFQYFRKKYPNQNRHQRRRQDQQRLTLDQDLQAADFAASIPVFFQSSRHPIVDRLCGDQQHGDNRQEAEKCRQYKNSWHSELETNQPDKAAPTTSPAWLNAWFCPFCRLNPVCRAIPSVIPITVGPMPKVLARHEKRMNPKLISLHAVSLSRNFLKAILKAFLRL